MSDQNDIIGIVKELKAAATSDEVRSYVGNLNLAVEISRNFPAVADALLIAVEALEEIDGKFMCPASTKALSRIRSLPS